MEGWQRSITVVSLSNRSLGARVRQPARHRRMHVAQCELDVFEHTAVPRLTAIWGSHKYHTYTRPVFLANDVLARTSIICDNYRFEADAVVDPSGGSTNTPAYMR